MRAEDQSKLEGAATDKKSRHVLIIAGPTASGKSAMAIDIAEHFNGTVINADSQQVYKELRVITARPPVEDEARVPHRLFGVVDGHESCSAGRWAEMAVAEIKAAWHEGRLPIVVGGTGMYRQALIEGMSPIPESPGDVRIKARARYEAIGAEAFHQEVATLDSATAERLPVGDTQRLLRAWEVTTHTGRPFSTWQDEPRNPPLPEAIFTTIAIEPPRDQLYASIDRRFSQMVELGVVDEVKALLAIGIAAELPVMKALGVPEIAAFVRGEITLDDAISKAQKLSRNYAKRQLTWVRNQVQAEFTLSAQYSQRFSDEILSFIHQFLLTKEA
ncbi:MAG: tRNA (adenosine(37)-N6)-dimethylallyltransferase MiaA [Sphingomonadales bacterium]|nr:tRNA (adenosine(37)-N6)-dimethylallyltransferase MiaA [Sphingomonadales bacterium]